MSAVGELERGRALCAQGAWREAHEALSAADRSMTLEPADLERLATSAYMLGRLEDYVEAMGRAHRLHLEGEATLPAVRCAFWTGMQLLLAGEMGRGTGWIGRAQRLVDDEALEECAERGYLLLPAAFRCQVGGRYDDGARIASEAAAIGRRCGDRDLFALAVHVQGHMLVRLGRVLDGLALLDEAMVAVTTGEISPIVTGMVYCGVILGCQHAYEPGRAREWTAALTEWCARQPDMVAFTGRCHVHRAELRQLEGAWSDALAEARRAAERAALGNHRSALAEAAYLQGDVHRLRGAFAEAEEAYRRASECGREPQPGLALLRLAQGRRPAAVAAIRRVLAEGSADPVARARQLPACAEIMIAAGELDAAREATDELEGIARGHEAGVLRTIAEQTRGAVELAAGDAEAALRVLRGAWRVWEELQAPYEAARTRVLIGEACRALQDHDAAAFELEAARRAFEQLGAIPDLERLDGGAGRHAARELSPREREVLRLVAGGRTNRDIAAELVLSERTVDRHLSNIFAKLGVSSRAAATAIAYERDLF
jgi:ATP/maltotriose-dependent transcriptional regulator MalT